MHLNADISSALQLLHNIKQVVDDLDDPKLLTNTYQDMDLLISTLENPIFRGIITVQDSLSELSQELIQHPSILPVDFDITTSGELVLNVPSSVDLYDPSHYHDRNGSARSSCLLDTQGSGLLGVGVGVDRTLDRNDEQRVPSAQLSPGSPQPPILSTFTSHSHSHNHMIPLSPTTGVTPNGPIDHQGNIILGRTVTTGQTASTLSNNVITATELQHQHQHQALSLQKSRGLVELVVTRNLNQSGGGGGTNPSVEDEDTVHRSPSAVSDTSKASSDCLLNSEWAQVEAIELINDGTGLGFGIIGGRTMGVVVKTILPGGVADRDGRLKSGDHILQIGDVNLHEMGSEQVATVLRQSGTRVKLVVARPAEPPHPQIVPTRLLNNPTDIDRYLMQQGYSEVFNKTFQLPHYDNASTAAVVNCSVATASVVVQRLPGSPSSKRLNLDLNLPVNEMEKFVIELKKDANGLGITIAGYVCEKEELSGIFVKSISAGSAADLSGKIQVNDRIVAVDGRSLQGYTNHEAVEVLRSSGNTVTLCLERYLRGPKYEQLQMAIAANEMKLPATPSLEPPTPSLHRPRYSSTSLDDPNDTDDPNPILEQLRPIEASNLHVIANHNTTNDNQPPIHRLQIQTPLTSTQEQALITKWKNIVGDDTEIVIAELRKFGESGGLGISLEGTVDVEDGREVRPHHYIRSILPEGPVGRDGTLMSGDELLEVNGCRLLGMNHMEVVSILKELPVNVRMVCGRSPRAKAVAGVAGVQGRTSSLQDLLPTTDRLVKAKSDGSLATSIPGTDGLLSKMRSRSLEPLTGLAMWSSEPQVIELIKGERGLGFSILDYQDPIDPNDTVIVIRSLVPGGVAQIDGRLIPGDRLLFVNDTVLENASLDQAVQALKGAPRGVVRIGVAKPLPVPDTLTQAQQMSTSTLPANHVVNVNDVTSLTSPLPLTSLTH
ncbi:patj homolog isoform X2 [Chrysoperla carnea]|uniref:patj homolog isoform X2 n=1 Tax=Chrysoperla carnea TaxID=189513 RepID=UPI001D08601C|nr:patj homolog isoform X2 [Chrysoperla carnea]